MAAKKKFTDRTCILFCYEGETEEEFYDRLFQMYLAGRGVAIKRKNLKGQFNLNKKVINFIDHNLEHDHYARYYCIVAHDREGPRETPSILDVSIIANTLKDVRLIGIDEILITQDLESALFIDIDGLHSFLKAPKAKRTPSKYRNWENFNNQDLSRLFDQFGGKYRKGHSCQNLIQNLDLQKIYENCPELRRGIELILEYGL